MKDNIEILVRVKDLFSKNIQKMINNLTLLEKGTQNADNSIEDFKKEVKKSSKTVNDFGKSTIKASKDVKKLGKAAKSSFSGIGAKITTLVAAYAGLMTIKNVISTFASFDDMMRSVSAVSKATTEELKDLTNIAKKMGAETKFSAREAAEGLKYLSMAGFKAKESIAALPGVLKLAAAGGLDLGQSADIATNVLSAYGKSVDELGSVNDILAATFTNTNSTLVEIGEGFKMVGPIAKGLGADFNDLVGALGQLHSAGIKSTMAGTGLRSALSTLFNPIANETKLMEELSDRIGGAGLQIKNSEGNFIGFISIVEQLEKAGIRGEEALALFGERAGPAMEALVLMGSKALKELNEEYKISHGLVDKISTQMESGLGGAIRQVIAGFEAIKIAIGEIFEVEIKEFVDNLKEYIGDLIKELKKFKSTGEGANFTKGLFEALRILVGATIWIVDFIVEWKKLIGVFVGSIVAIKALHLLHLELLFFKTTLLPAFISSIMGMVGGLTSLRLAIVATTKQMTIMSLAFKGFIALAAAQGIIKISQLIKEILLLNKVISENAKRAEEAEKEAKKFEHAKDTEIKSKKELIEMSEKERLEYKENAKDAMLYYSKMRESAELMSTDRKLGFLPMQSSKGADKEKEAIKLNDITNKYIESLKEVTIVTKELNVAQAESKGQVIDKVKKLTKLEIDGAKEATKVIKKEINIRLKEYVNLNKEIADLQNKLIDQQVSREDDIRAIKQRGMDVESKQYDLSKQFSEKIQAAQEILKKNTNDLTEAEIERATSLAEQSKNIAKGLTSEYDAIQKTKKAWDVLDQLVKVQQEKKRKELKQTIIEVEKLNKQLVLIEKQITIDVKADTVTAERNVLSLLREIEKLKDKTVTLTVVKKTKIKKKEGGSIGLKTGGKISGYGGGDKVDALLEKGEFIIRKEAVKKHGVQLFEKLNSVYSHFSIPIPRFAKGGIVGLKRKLQLEANPYSPMTSNGITYNINNPSFYGHVSSSISKITQPQGISAISNITDIFKSSVTQLATGGQITDSMLDIRNERDLIINSYEGQIRNARIAGEFDIARNLAKEQQVIEQLALELELTLAELELEYRETLKEIEIIYENTKFDAENLLSESQAGLVEKKISLEKKHWEDTAELTRKLNQTTIALNQAEMESKPTVVKSYYGMIMGSKGAVYKREILELNKKQREAKASIPGLQKDVQSEKHNIKKEKDFYKNAYLNIFENEDDVVSRYNNKIKLTDDQKESRSELAVKKYEINVNKIEKTTDLNVDKNIVDSRYERNKISIDLEKDIYELQMKMNRELINLQKQYSEGGNTGIRHWLSKGGYVPAFADGGGVFQRLKNPYIPGFGTKDDVPAMLMKGEFVLNKDAVKKYGLGFLRTLNNMSTNVNLIPQFAKGGIVDLKRKLQLKINPLSSFTDNGVTYNINNPTFHNHLKEKTNSINSPLGKGSASDLINIFSQSSVSLQEGGEITTATQRLITEKLRVSTDYSKRIEFAKLIGEEEIAYALEEEKLNLEQLADDLLFILEEMMVEYKFKKAELEQNFNYNREEMIRNHEDSVNQLTAEKIGFEKSYSENKKAYQLSLQRANQNLYDIKKGSPSELMTQSFISGSPSSELFRMSTMSYFQKQAYDLSMRQTIAGTEKREDRQQNALVSAKANLESVKESFLGVESTYKRNIDSNKSRTGRENNLFPAKKTRIESKFKREDNRLDDVHQRDTKKYNKDYSRDTEKVQLDAKHIVTKIQLDMEKEIHSLQMELAKTLLSLEKEYSTSSMSGVKYWLNKGGFLGYPLMAEKGKDSVKAMLTPGEYVIKESVVKNLGRSFFDKINNFQLPDVYKFAGGGLVGADSNTFEKSKENYDGSVTFQINNEKYKMNGHPDIAKSLVNELRKMGMVTR